MKLTYTRSRKLFRPRRGAEVLELALLMLPLLWLTFGAIDFGWYFYLQHNLEGAAREGARAGIISGNGNAKVRDAVVRVMENSGFKNQSLYDITQAYQQVSPSDASQGIMLNVQVIMKYTAMGIPPARVQATTVTGDATMRLED